MSDDKPSNVGTITDQNYAFQLIRFAFALVAGLAASYLTFIIIEGWLGMELTNSAETIVGMSITGFFGFLAGRKV